MKITKVERQKKRPDRYSVYIDDEFAFGVSEGDMLRLGVYSGKQLSPDELDKLRADADSGNAHTAALNYLSIRPRSQKEIRDHLKRKDYSTEAISAVISRLHDSGLVDDCSFAKQWVEWRQIGRPRSRRQLRAELSAKGVDSQYIDEALESIDDDAEVQLVMELIAKHGRRYQTREKLMAYLSRQGYSYDVIRRAVDKS